MSFIRKISPSASDDSELLLRYRETGDTDTLAELFDRYVEMIFAVCIKYLEDRETAKDAVMDIYQQLTVKISKHDVQNFRGWLYTLAKNHCLMQLRSLSGNRSVSIDESRMQLVSEMHPYSENEKEMQFDRLSECMEKLSAEQKQVIDLFYLQEKCYNDIVRISGYEWNKVRSLVQNGRRNLKICMDKMEIAAENGVIKKDQNPIT